jgi:hypothetical protein
VLATKFVITDMQTDFRPNSIKLSCPLGLLPAVLDQLVRTS